MKVAINKFGVALRGARSVSALGAYQGVRIEADIHVIEVALGTTHHQHSRPHMEDKNGRRTCRTTLKRLQYS